MEENFMLTLSRTNVPHLAPLEVSPSLLLARFGRGCATSRCDATCCALGVLVDVQQHAQILAHADIVRGVMDPEQDHDPGHWFAEELLADVDCPSGHGMSTRVEGNRCVFLNRAGRCVLQMATSALGRGGIDLKPFFCTLFPIIIDRGVLMLDPSVRGPATCCAQCPDGELTVLDVCSAELHHALGCAGVEDLRRLMSRRPSEAASRTA